LELFRSFFGVYGRLLTNCLIDRPRIAGVVIKPRQVWAHERRQRVVVFADIRESNKLITNLTIAGVSPVFREMFSPKTVIPLPNNPEEADSCRRKPPSRNPTSSEING
jgi:hypothetical protein